LNSRRRVSENHDSRSCRISEQDWARFCRDHGSLRLPHLVSPLVTGSTDSERITPFKSRAAAVKLPYHTRPVEMDAREPVRIWEVWAARCSPEGLLLVNAVHTNIVHSPRQPSWQVRFRMAASSASPR
jgi:hypothetical protein